MDDSDSLFKAVSQLEASFEVTAKATYYPHFVEVFIPTIPYSKLKPGMHSDTKLKPGASINKTNKEDNETRSLRRSKKSIRDYALCNHFELFVTFTFARERQDTDRCRARMANWIKNQQKRSGKFQYLIVPERHKDGALHFHALLKGFKGKIERAIHPATGKPLIQRRRKVYEIPSYRAGFTNVKIIEDTPESHSKVARYLAKYVTKDMPLFANKNRYWSSHGLKIPIVVYNPPAWYLEETPEWSHESEYGKTLIIPYRSKHDELGEVVSLMERDEASLE